jgi:hypothetical protein
MGCTNSTLCTKHLVRCCSLLECLTCFCLDVLSQQHSMHMPYDCMQQQQMHRSNYCSRCRLHHSIVHITAALCVVGDTVASAHTKDCDTLSCCAYNHRPQHRATLYKRYIIAYCITVMAAAAAGTAAAMNLFSQVAVTAAARSTRLLFVLSVLIVGK